MEDSLLKNDEVLRLCLVQQDIVWENIDANLELMSGVIRANAGRVDVLVFPEMCTTGFCSNVDLLGEPQHGKSYGVLKSLAKECDVAICGSYIVREGSQSFNRAFFITPGDDFFYDKRHLFRLGAEVLNFTPGNSRCIFNYKGFSVCLQICYDLRFPVWARNYHNEYDLLIYVANWPASRIVVWETLLKARALENMAFVCGVNRIGTDENAIRYNGCSCVYDAKGRSLFVPSEVGGCFYASLSKKELEAFREKFPVWMDADRFEIFC